jgi:anaerobic selenocysteine-containing dehydrogenase
LSDDANELWNCDRLPSFNKAFKGETEEEGSLIFLSPNTKNRIHSQFGNLDVIKLNDPEPLLQINKVDANRIGLISKELVRVYNDRGEIHVKIDITSRIKTGCVSMPNGWWISENGGGNYLSEGRETDMGFGTAFHDNRVKIEKLSNARGI